MLTGERRFLSARRGGMTVLGKVTVPKPINLPSQRLENHGLDPDVEIVPKGTHNWGARSSSSVQNPWGSPAQSPPKIGGTDLSNHLNGRPSSGGSGTRPSTAGSDKSHEPVSNVWGPSSRPSSASGVTTSNQSSLAAARPRSAEPRPASSQLSRFAEPVSENSVAWSSSGTMEKLGAPFSKAKDFSLTTGDFPTLGSEKTTESHVQQDHISQGRPVSASGRAATSKERSETSQPDDASLNARIERGPVNTSENKNILNVELADSPSMEKWQRETMPYPDQHMPQQFGPWHGAPHPPPPNGVWYRGPFGGPYGPPGPPGSYPHDPFAYYHPRLPARPAANMQPVLQPGSAPSGYYPDKGDSHRPHMPDSYIPPVMSYGPGPYPVQMPYDGYYGPQRVGISSERRPQSMGGMGSTRVYNRYPIHNAHPDSGSFHGASGYGPSSTSVMEQGGSGHQHGNRQGPYKVLMKHHDGWEENDSKDRREHGVSTPCLDRDNQPGTPTGKTAQTASSQYADFGGGHSPKTVDLGLPRGLSKDNRVEDSLVQKPEPSYPGDGGQQLTSAKKNSTLIEKIEGLNQKARVYRASNSKADDSPSEIYNGKDYPNKAPMNGTLSTPSIEMNPALDKRVDEVISVGEDVSRPVHEPQVSINIMNSSNGQRMVHRNAQKRPHVMQDKVDDRGKARSNFSKDEEWREKPHVAPFSSESSSKKDETCDDGAQDQHASLRASEKLNSSQGKPGGSLSKIDSNDHQRAKMKEIVAERAKQLQKEEEERIREQKARALAKLEELDRRKLSEIPTEKVVHAMPQSELPQKKQEMSHSITGPVTDANTSSGSCSSGLDCVTVNPSSWNYDTIIPTGWDSDPDTHGHDGPSDLPKIAPVEAPQSARPVRNPKYKPPEIEMKEVGDNSGHRQKQSAAKKKQNISRSSNDKSVFVGDSGQTKSNANVLGDVNALSGEFNSNSSTNAKDDKHKKKTGRGKNKNKLDEVPSEAHATKVVSVDGSSLKSSVGSSKIKTSVAVFEVGSVQVPFSIEIAESQDAVVPSTDQGRLLPTEVHGAVNNQSKPHPPRRPRNTQVPEKLHGSETVVWAPVGSVKKNADSEDTRLNSAVEVSQSSGVGRETQSNHKSRRAEIERYVPKPVAKEAKEHISQGNTEPTQPSSVNHMASNGMTGRIDSSLNKETGGPNDVLGKGGLAAVSKVGEGKHNKHVKTYGLWRPRVSGETSLVQPTLDESSYSSGPSSMVQKSPEQHQNPKTSFPDEQAKYTDISNAFDSTLNEPVSNSTGKDHVVTSRGKRQPFKGPKSGGSTQNNSDHDLQGREKFEAVSPSALESNKGDGRVALGEKQTESNKGSHWQPKSQTQPSLNHQGSVRDGGGQKANRVGKAPAKQYPTHGGEHLESRTDKDYNQSQLHPHSDRSNEQRASVAGAPHVHHHETRPQNKDLNSPRQGRHVNDPYFGNSAKSKDPSEHMNSQKEQFFPGPRRQGNQNRYGRTHEDLHGSQYTGVQDDGKHQLPQSSDRRKHDSHYEYQRTRSSGNEPIESFDEGPRVTGSRYRERGQTNSRRGGANSYVRDGGEQNF